MKSITFISGWGIPQEWLAKRLRNRYPNHHILVVAPIPNWERKLDAEKNTQLHAYSLGTLLVGCTPIPKTFSSIHFYAPILNFISEKNCGSRVKAVELSKMIDAFEKNPLLTLNHFFRKCKLPIQLTKLPESKKNLLWGLQVLRIQNVNPLAGVCYYCGKEDPLINHKILSLRIKHLRTIPQGNHNIETLWHSPDEIKPSI